MKRLVKATLLVLVLGLALAACRVTATPMIPHAVVYVETSHGHHGHHGHAGGHGHHGD